VGPTLIPGLGEELTAAAGRLHRRRRRRLRAAAAGSLAVVFIAAMAVTATIDAPPAAAGLEITERDGRVEVRLTDIETRPHVVEDALEAADIDADVAAVPVSPSLIGQFIRISGSNDAGIEPLDGDGLSAPGFSVSAGFDGHLDLSLGRPAEAGEALLAFGNALSAGEPLECLDLLGAPVRQLADVAAAHPDLEITVRPFAADGPEPALTAIEVASSPYADWILIDARTFAADAVGFDATADGLPAGSDVPPPPPTGC
jgi:hypothetical protein